MCQSAPIASRRLNRKGTAIRLSASISRRPRKPPIERQDRTAGVDDQRDRRAGRIEAKDIRPRARQLPEAERVVAIKGEERERRCVNCDQGLGIWTLGSRPAQERQSAGAGDRGDDRLAQHDGDVEGERQQRDAAEPRKPGRATHKRACKSETLSPCLRRSPIRVTRFLADCLLSCKRPFPACRPPHSGPIWRLCALVRL